jgi:hypothetical protein
MLLAPIQEGASLGGFEGASSLAGCPRADLCPRRYVGT